MYLAMILYDEIFVFHIFPLVKNRTIIERVCRRWRNLSLTFFNKRIPISVDEYIKYFVKQGDIKLLNWINERHMRILSQEEDIYKYYCDGFIQSWIRDGIRAYRNACLGNKNNMIIATRAGNLEVLKWFSGNRKDSPFYTYPIENDVVQIAIEEGHLHILQWLRSNNYIEMINPDNVIRLAEQYGQNKVVEWAQGLTQNLDMTYLNEDGEKVFDCHEILKAMISDPKEEY